MPARPSSAFATAVAVIAACATAAGCGGAPPKPQPSQHDVAVITTSVSDVVFQCQSAAAEFIAAPDHSALKRDVDRLVSAAARLRADAPFRSARGPRTTLRQQLALAARNLRARCSPEQAARLDDAIK